jgi:copper transport protein
MNLVAKGLCIGIPAVCLAVFSLQARGGDEDVPREILTKINPVASSDTALAKAKKSYSDNCIQCHGETGRGDGPMAGMLKEPPADLTKTESMTQLTDGEIFWNLTKGIDKVMPPFESKLTDEERWGLVHLLRNLSNTKPNNTPRPGRK